MCDTVVAVGNSTKDGSVILGMNSNRIANEAHNIEYTLGKKHSRNSKVSNEAFNKSIKKITEWTEIMEKLPVKAKPSFRNRVFWNRQNKQVMLEI